MRLASVPLIAAKSPSWQRALSVGSPLTKGEHYDSNGTPTLKRIAAKG